MEGWIRDRQDCHTVSTGSSPRVVRASHVPPLAGFLDVTDTVQRCPLTYDDVMRKHMNSCIATLIPYVLYRNGLQPNFILDDEHI